MAYDALQAKHPDDVGPRFGAGPWPPWASAKAAFADPHRVIARDFGHSEAEERFYCFGQAGGGVLTVRFTYRRKVIRIIGAGF